MGRCGKIAKLIGAYICGGLTPGEMRAVRQHVEECESCRQDLESRMRVASLIPNDLPVMSSDERSQIVWSVKGAVRAKQNPPVARVFGWKLLQGVAAFAILFGAFAGGMAYQSKNAPVKVVVKTVPVEQTKPKTKDPVAVKPKSAPADASPRLIVTAPTTRDRLPETFRNLGHGRRTRPDQLLTVPETPVIDPEQMQEPIQEEFPQSLDSVIETPDDKLEASPKDQIEQPIENPPDQSEDQ